MTILARLSEWLAAQRGFLMPWVPVLMGTGAATYAVMRHEPTQVEWLILAGVLVALAALLRLMPAPARPMAIAPAMLLIGFVLAGARAYHVAAPVLDFRYYGPVTGRVVQIDRSASDKPRMTLDRVIMNRVDPDDIPTRVRVSMHGDQGYVDPLPGMVVMMTAHLAAPEGPVEPGGYDFRRQAWYDRLGAVGYTRTPVLLLDPAPWSLDLAFAQIRMTISGWVQRSIPGPAGALGAVLMSGDRSGLNQQTQDDLRASNLSHLLSISGLHMALLCGTVFSALRLFMAAIPPLALRYQVKKIAAVCAMSVGLFYYLLTGGEVPAERAFIMVSVMFTAVLFDRRAISIRSVAIAAIFVLTLRPETVTEPGFQMSFAATIALVAVFGEVRHMRRLPKWISGAAMLLLSSAVAGGATAPFAAAHFNRIADYGLIANLLSVPLMGLIVMPAALLSIVLLPVGLGWLGLWVMQWPLKWILLVAHTVAHLDGAVTRVWAPPAGVLPLLAWGGLFLVLWQGRLWVRGVGVLPILAAFVLWSQATRPDLLITSDGRLLGLMTPKGRALSKDKGQGFAADSWLEDDGDPATQEQAAARRGLTRSKDEVIVTLDGLTIRQFFGRGAAERARAACGSPGTLIIVTGKPPRGTEGCSLIDERTLARTGPLSITRKDGRLVIDSTRARSGNRLWSPGPAPETLPLPVPTDGAPPLLAWRQPVFVAQRDGGME